MKENIKKINSKRKLMLMILIIQNSRIVFNYYIKIKYFVIFLFLFCPAESDKVKLSCYKKMLYTCQENLHHPIYKVSFIPQMDISKRKIIKNSDGDNLEKILH